MKSLIGIAAALAIGAISLPANARESFNERTCKILRFESAGFLGPIAVTVHHAKWTEGGWQDQSEYMRCNALPGGEHVDPREAQAIGRPIKFGR